MVEGAFGHAEDLATAGVFTDLQIEQSVHPLEPLVKGEWA